MATRQPPQPAAPPALTPRQHAVLIVGAAILAGPYGKTIMDHSDSLNSLTKLAKRSQQFVDIVLAMEGV